jgi:Kef-type K+ transport system membrane component KefB
VLTGGTSAAIVLPALEERHLLQGSDLSVSVWAVLVDALSALILPFTLLASGSNHFNAVYGDLGIIAAGAVIVIAGRRVFTKERGRALQRASKRHLWGLQMRLTLLILAAFGLIAERSGASLLVAGLATGVVIRQLRPSGRLEVQLVGLANGLFVPAFFVILGATINVRPLLTDPKLILLSVAIAAGSCAVDLLAAAVVRVPQVLASGLVASAQLGLPAAAASLGLSTHLLSDGQAAAILLGALLTLVLSSIGTSMLKPGKAV